MKKFYTFAYFFSLFLSIFSASGQNWENLGDLSVGGTEIGFVDQMVGYDSGLYICSDLGLFRTADTGNSFSNLTYESGPTTGLRITTIFFDETENTLYAGGESDIFKSTDNGSTWSATGVTGTQRINGIARKNGNLLASFGNSFGSGGVYYSTDGFASYTQGTGLPDLRMIGFYTKDDLLFLAGEDGVYGSQDNGVTWALQGTGHENAVTDIKFIKKSALIYVADRDGSGLYQTEDNGATWVETDPVTFAGFCQIFDIILSQNVIYVVTDGTGCANSAESIKLSTDNGVTWSSGLFNLPQAFYASLGVTVDGCVFTYAPFEDKLYRLCDGPLEVNENSLDMVGVFPNPTTDQLTFMNATIASFEIYDSKGSVVLKNTNLNSNTMDVASLTPGIYFLKIHTDKNQIQNIRFVKK